MAKYQMSGAELASMLKGQLNNNMKFNGIIGVDDPSLHLSEDEIEWWRSCKLGLFVHWGVYSVIGKGEWAYFNEKIPEAEYRRITEEEFRPKRTAEEIAEEWIQTAEAAGMRYAVMVTRHHDGFAMWDSRCSWKQYTSAVYGPKTDYVKAFTDACHKHGLYTGLYYSPMDWRFPGYFDPKGETESAMLLKQQAYGQLEELCTKYGRVDILWYDGGWLAHEGTDADAAWFWEPIRMNRMIRALQPGIMVTPRSGYRGDFECDEGCHPARGKIVPIPWEKCMSISEAWGYKPVDTYQDGAFLIRMLADVICRDGNLLLNVGPDPDGRIPEQAKCALNQLGAWVQQNEEAVYGTRAGYLEPVDHVYGSTQRDHTLYLYILDEKAFREEVLRIPADQILQACFLEDHTTVQWQAADGGVRFLIPDSEKCSEPVRVIRVELK